MKTNCIWILIFCLFSAIWQGCVTNPTIKSNVRSQHRNDIEEITNQAVLGKIALGDREADIRQAAVAKLTDQVLLAKIAAEDDDLDVRQTAIGRITDKALLDETILKARVAAAERPGNVQVSDVTNPSAEVAAAILDLKSVLDNPLVAMEWPNIHFFINVKVEPTSANYSGGGSISGENVVILVKQGTKTLAGTHRYSVFPNQTSKTNFFLGAGIDTNPMLEKLFRKLKLSEESLVKPTRSDQIQLANFVIARNDRNITIGGKTFRFGHSDSGTLGLLAEIATEKITDQDLLGKVAIESTFDRCSKTAFEKISDQSVLAQIAMESDEPTQNGPHQNLREVYRESQPLSGHTVMYSPEISVMQRNGQLSSLRYSAVLKLTNQAVLAKLAMESEYRYIREAAVNKLTDEAVLTKLTMADKAEDIRMAAEKRLAKIRAEKH